jgi:heme exporter protein A
MTLIELEHLTKTYGLVPALRDLNLQIARGTCVALLGHNGSGKSTLLKLLSGLARPTSGRLTVGGWRLPQEAAAVRRVLGIISHKPLLYDGLTARENLRFFGRLYALEQLDARINTLLAQVGLQRRAETLVRTFSRGMLQRLSIARALLHEPEMLLMDEPHTGLDQDGAAMLDQIITDAHRKGNTVLLATHELARAHQLADRVLILRRGVVLHDSAPLADAAALQTRYAEVNA